MKITLIVHNTYLSALIQKDLSELSGFQRRLVLEGINFLVQLPFMGSVLNVRSNNRDELLITIMPQESTDQRVYIRLVELLNQLEDYGDMDEEDLKKLSTALFFGHQETTTLH